jgi:Dyp-type peroxidase family
MSVNLDLPAAQVDLGTATYANLRANLQANILKSHGRGNQRHVFLEFKGTAAAVKTWIKTHVLPKLTTAEIQHQHALARAANPAFDGGLITGFFLSADGYKKLGFSVDGFASRAFRRGMKAEGAGKKDPAPSTWEPGFRGTIHALVSFADTQPGPVDAAVTALKATMGTAVKDVAIEHGRALTTPGGVGGKPSQREHFEYVDGVSNPRFEGGGTTSALADPRWDDGAPLRLALTADPLATGGTDVFGSYFVFRKLGQDVALFNSRVVQLSTAVGMPPNLAGAMVVGRFKDGTPVVDSDTANGPTEENGFDYSDPDDKFRCPAHAHIRKTNPRGTTPLTSLADERKRRIVRRGIPYGKPVFPVIGGFEDPSPTEPRGLLFMCFQRNIENQFVFIQRTWVDNPEFPDGIVPLVTTDTGDDPLIGQDRDEGQRWPKSWGDESAGRKKFNFESAVTLKGGEYFFAPSKLFISSL